MPSLNAARREFYEATNNDAILKPYESWIDYAGHLKNEASIINFVAAYGTHALITGQTTIEGKRDAALTIITGQSFGGFVVPTDAEDFLNGTGAYAADLGGLENVDLWIGGLAEQITPFGGMLGSTFNFVFETTMEKLQNGDRFYYLQRLDGLHLFSEMEGNSFAAMIMRNTDATHLPSDVFSTPGTHPGGRPHQTVQSRPWRNRRSRRYPRRQPEHRARRIRRQSGHRPNGRLRPDAAGDPQQSAEQPELTRTTCATRARITSCSAAPIPATRSTRPATTS